MGRYLAADNGEPIANHEIVLADDTEVCIKTKHCHVDRDPEVAEW